MCSGPLGILLKCRLRLGKSGVGAGFCISPSPPSLPGQAGRREAQSSCEETKLEKPERSHGLKPEEKPRKVAVSLVTLGPHVPAGARAPWKLSPRLRSRPSSECGGRGEGRAAQPGGQRPGGRRPALLLASKAGRERKKGVCRAA